MSAGRAGVRDRRSDSAPRRAPLCGWQAARTPPSCGRAAWTPAGRDRLPPLGARRGIRGLRVRLPGLREPGAGGERPMRDPLGEGRAGRRARLRAVRRNVQEIPIVAQRARGPRPVLQQPVRAPLATHERSPVRRAACAVRRDVRPGYQADVDSAIATAGYYTTDQFAGVHASAPSVVRADAIAGVAPSDIGVYSDGQLLVGDAALGVRGTRRLVFPRTKAASDQYRRAIVENDHRARYLDEDFMVRQQRRTVGLLIAKGLRRDQAEAAAEAAVRIAVRKRRKAIRRRGPRPSATPSPINVERARAVEEARLELQAELEAGIRTKPISARAARLRAAQNIAAHSPRLLPSDHIAERSEPSSLRSSRDRSAHQGGKRLQIDMTEFRV